MNAREGGRGSGCLVGRRERRLKSGEGEEADIGRRRCTIGCLDQISQLSVASVASCSLLGQASIWGTWKMVQVTSTQLLSTATLVSRASIL